MAKTFFVIGYSDGIATIVAPRHPTQDKINRVFLSSLGVIGISSVITDSLSRND
jgi:hypothetical protein